MCVFVVAICCVFFFFFKQKTAYEMRISDWSSDVCSSDLTAHAVNDAAVLTELTVRWVRESGLPAIVVPEMSYAVELARDWFGDLPDDEIGRASCRERVCQYV